MLLYRSGQEFTNILKTTTPESFVTSPLIYPWANFDGVHYIEIAKFGYTTEAGFFPLYPILIKILSLFIGNYFIAAILISNTSFVVGLIFFHKLIKLDYPNKIANQAIIFLLIFPTSFFFAAAYSESLFLALLMSCLYFTRKRMWFLASILGLLLSSTRIVGILILPVLFWEFYTLEKTNFKNISLKLISLFLVPLGLLSYMIFNYIHWGNFMYFIKAQGMFSNNRSVDQVILFPQTLFRYSKIIATVPYQQYEWWIALVELSLTFFVLTLLLFGFKQRMRISYLIFSILVLLLPISSGTLSGMPRYVLMTFPIYITIALFKNKYLKITYFILCLFLLTILWTLFTKGYYVA